MLLLLGLLVDVEAAAAAVAGPTPLPMLFMDLLDTIQVDNYGLLVPTASTAAHDSTVRPPPGLDYTAGVINFAVLPSLTTPGSWEAYSANATGWEPRAAPGTGTGAAGVEERRSQFGQPPPNPQWLGLSLLRSTTTDFWTWSEPEACTLDLGLTFNHLSRYRRIGALPPTPPHTHTPHVMLS